MQAKTFLDDVACSLSLLERIPTRDYRLQYNTLHYFVTLYYHCIIIKTCTTHLDIADDRRYIGMLKVSIEMDATRAVVEKQLPIDECAL